MGGKRLKFPTRQKYVAPIPKKEKDETTEDKPISEEEHQKRMELLKGLGLIKEEGKENKSI